MAGGPALQSERAVDCHTDAQCMNALRAVDHKCPKGETGRAPGAQREGETCLAELRTGSRASLSMRPRPFGVYT